MIVYMDRQWCSCWQAACEATFGWKLLYRDFGPGGCMVETEEDGRPELTFYIKDRDGVDKVLVVTEENWADAYDSWLLLWQRQERERAGLVGG
ncbi:MAG: hypothetical protein M5U01_37275 [Ardenticatenaceae bacterium]|nr:hypothetical protein [Ardenticatenaceae bacterium]HBY97670.1 hypothetical protein [Chloroflexota bacterium]